ncbi:sodium/calcium exchanger protein [Amycolatopsis cihanbeyliensis]|uniref:sodium/calcium exchanger protein n=1 Tax=Amycolatopsis cihanbeyliensis TaxID=1128664 RepID=UPI001FEA490E|nr:sodium/calcium exchanger protein [Amycolatopsis cihanbeyliensis]
MVALYLGGLKIARVQRPPMWRPVTTSDTRADRREDHDRQSKRPLYRLWAGFLALDLLVVIGGGATARAAGTLLTTTQLNAGVIGGIFMAVVNALPETLTAIVAARRGAVTLAIAGVIGGHCLDALNLAVGDLAYGGGSLFHAAGTGQLFLTTTALLMTAVLLGGLLVRQRHGWWRMGFDGVLLMLIYAIAVVTLAF